MNTKGDISMNMIIMAVIALLVLAIIAFLIFRSGGDVQEATQCVNLGNSQCLPSSCGGDFPIRNLAGSCDIDGEVCCTTLS